MHRSRLRWFVLLVLIAGAVIAFLYLRPARKPQGPAGAPSQEELIERGLGLLNEQEEKAAREFWALEYRAQEYGKVVDQFWDRLNGSSNKFAVAGEIKARVLLPAFASAVSLPHGIQVMAGNPGARY